MKNKLLFFTVFSLILGAQTPLNAMQLPGITVTEPVNHLARCIVAACPDDVPAFISTWLDPAFIAATALDYAANMSEDERTIDASDAIEKLEESLNSGCSGSGDSGEETSLDETDTVVVAPEIVVNSSQKDEDFVAVRSAVEDYLFETEGCNHDCALQRQNTWLLTSLDMAAAMADKLLSASTTMSSEYSTLLSGFNSQKSPMGMWGASAQITLHTHVQANDINALYARDLEMNSLNGVRDAEDTRLMPRDQPLIEE